MRICFVSHSGGSGGAERVLLETIELLQAHGVECRVLLPSGGHLCQELIRLGVPFSVISYPMWMGRGKFSFLARVKAAVGVFTNTVQVAWRIFRWKCDVVYSNTATVCVGALAARLLACPHIWHLHEFGMEDQGLSFLFGDRFSLALIDRLSARCICVSHALAKKYQKSIAASKITVIYPSMHRVLNDSEDANLRDSLESSRPKRFRCVIVGALIPGKGQEDAVLAFAHLKKTGIAAELTIVGDGDPEFRRYLEDVIRSNNLVDNVVFVGHVNNALPAMRSSDVILVCSRSEAFGRVTIEGMFAGRPVIGARSAATAELIQDGINGLLYNPGDSKDLAAKIISIYRDPQTGERLAARAQEWMKGHFTSRRYTEDILNLIQSSSNRSAANISFARQA
jgi:glycosyltransferase involved in cell wall biosynthesis